jgi:hypothetical protein
VTGRPPRAFKVDDAGLHDAPGVAAHGEVDMFVPYSARDEAAASLVLPD